VVPREAVQTVGDWNVVYIAVEGDDGRFAECPVKLGAVMGDSVQVLEGVNIGDRVVTTGSSLHYGERWPVADPADSRMTFSIDD